MTNKIRNKEMKFVGAHVPRHISSYLSLYCYRSGMAKSSLIRAILSNWVDEKESSTHHRYDLIRGWVQQLQLEWDNTKLTSEEARRNTLYLFQVFKHLQAISLRGRGLEEEDVKNIIKQLII